MDNNQVSPNQIRDAVLDWETKNKKEATVMDVVVAILQHKYGHMDNTDTAIFICDIIESFRAGCNVNFNELYEKALEVKPVSLETKLQSLKDQIAELEKEIKEG